MAWISTRKARKLRKYVTRKIAMKRELDAYLAERQAAIDHCNAVGPWWRRDSAN